MPQPAPTPSPQATSRPSLERQFFTNLLRDQKAIWTAPLKLRGRDAQWLIPLGGGTATLIATDRRTTDEVDDGRGLRTASLGVSRVGAFYTTAGVAATFYVVGRATNNARARETGLLGTEALLNGVIVTTTLKTVTQRPRPGRGGRRGRFFEGGNSFPSGHATNAWALATVVAYEYKDRPLVRYGAYGLATAVSLSRFTGRKHFLSDALVGSAIGYGIGRYVYLKHHDPNVESSGGQPERSGNSGRFPLITPQYNRRARAYGVNLVWSF